jgi:hypothetical protein
MKFNRLNGFLSVLAIGKCGTDRQKFVHARQVRSVAGICPCYKARVVSVRQVFVRSISGHYSLIGRCLSALSGYCHFSNRFCPFKASVCP